MTDADREELHPPSGDDVSEISAGDPPRESDIDPHEPDIEIVARVRADELRFDAGPEVEIRSRGAGRVILGKSPLERTSTSPSSRARPTDACSLRLA
jgi:hypothetical protein